MAIVERSRRFTRLAGLWTAILGSAGTVVAFLMGGPALAWGVALGALAAGVNLAFMADEVAWLVSTRAHPEDAKSGAKPPLARLRLPLFLLALAGILWYTPARPEGIAGGILLVLAAAVISGFLTQRHAPPPTSHSD